MPPDGDCWYHTLSAGLRSLGHQAGTGRELRRYIAATSLFHLETNIGPGGTTLRELIETETHFARGAKLTPLQYADLMRAYSPQRRNWAGPIEAAIAAMLYP